MKSINSAFFLFIVALMQYGISKEKIEYDTMVVSGPASLFPAPKADMKKALDIAEKSLVLVLDKKPVIEAEYRNSWTRVQTIDGKAGYIASDCLLTKKHYNALLDSIAYWSKRKIPEYENLLKKTFKNIRFLSPELACQDSMGGGEDQDYSLLTFENRYNKDFYYIFLTRVNTGTPGGLTHTIMDIVPLRRQEYGLGARVRFGKCECESGGDCSQMLGLYYHDYQMAKEHTMVIPDKAWWADCKAGKLEEVMADTVRCGSDMLLDE